MNLSKKVNQLIAGFFFSLNEFDTEVKSRIIERRVDWCGKVFICLFWSIIGRSLIDGNEWIFSFSFKQWEWRR